MVNKLRKKFVITAMLSLLLILIIMIAVINLVNVYQMTRDADNLLSILTTNDGFFPGMLDDNRQLPPPDDNSSEASSQDQFRRRDDFKFQDPGEPFAFGWLNDMRSLEMPYQSRYFWVKYDSSGAVTEVNTMHVAAITEEEATSFAADVYGSSRKKRFLPLLQIQSL